MKITVSKENYLKAIAEADRLTLVATDLEVGIRYELVGVRVEEPGEAIFPINRLLSILRESPANDIAIDADEPAGLAD